MAQREVQSVEVSCLILATEDEERVKEHIERYLGIAQSPEEEHLEGHFGNRILHVRWHLTGEQGWECFRSLLSLLGDGGREELLAGLRTHLDEHRALYVRLSKQALTKGEGVLAETDSVRVKFKPRSFAIGGSTESFYRRLIEGGR